MILKQSFFYANLKLFFTKYTFNIIKNIIKDKFIFNLNRYIFLLV